MTVLKRTESKKQLNKTNAPLKLKILNTPIEPIPEKQEKTEVVKEIDETLKKIKKLKIDTEKKLQDYENVKQKSLTPRK